MERKWLGGLGERLAADFLKKQGCQIIETNYRCPEGEIDIVAEKGDCLVFVEVRARKSTSFGTPEESLTRAKKERLKNSGLHYLATHPHSLPQWRIDFVAIELDRQGRVSRMELIENAVE